MCYSTTTVCEQCNPTSNHAGAKLAAIKEQIVLQHVTTTTIGRKHHDIDMTTDLVTITLSPSLRSKRLNDRLPTTVGLDVTVFPLRHSGSRKVYDQSSPTPLSPTARPNCDQGPGEVGPAFLILQSSLSVDSREQCEGV
jgi:hypothetical protein